MICPTYTAARNAFAAPGALTAADGLPAFPGPQQANGSFSNVALYLRPVGFSATWTVTTQGGTIWGPGPVGAIGPLIAGTVPGGDPLFPITITINGGASDGGTNAYWWYLSQRSDNLRYVLADGTLSATGQPQYFTMAHPSDGLHSGTVIIAPQGAQIAKLFPRSGGTPPTDAVSLATLFTDCALYVSRVSDSAYQWARFTSS